ncbi:hypothetical protein BDZ97DRAFT_1768564 [Flammula alnicola]|nr:hypothetical protein BDZ97DRAFT_1768564 [Flammula alnicola]
MWTWTSSPPTVIFDQRALAYDEAEDGISDNAGEGAEQSQLSSNTGKAKHYFGGSSNTKEIRVQSLAKIDPTTSVASFISSTASSQIISPTDEALAELWSQVFPQEPKLNFATHEGVVVKKLDHLSTWRNKFRSTALQFLQNSLFRRLPDNSTNSLAVCQDHNQLFYYMTYEEPEEEGKKVNATGLFQSPLITAVLSAHISSISPISPELRSDKKPISALILSIQAAKCTLMRWTTGEEVKPHRPFGDFSKTNWEKQWEKILKAATEVSKAKKETIMLAPVPDVSGPGEPEFELIDDDSDLADD